MKRGRSTGKPTAAQQVRMDAIREIGYIVARSLGLGYVPCEVHHLTVGGKHGAKRRGHDFTVGLNPWSHRGEPFGGMSAETCERLFGPSYAKQLGSPPLARTLQLGPMMGQEECHATAEKIQRRVQA